MDIGGWVRAARGRKGWTQEDLGEKVGRTKANVSHWELKNHDLSVAQLLRIEELTGHPLGLLVWPLPLVDNVRFYALPEKDRAYAQAKMMAAIEEREAATPQAAADAQRIVDEMSKRSRAKEVPPVRLPNPPKGKPPRRRSTGSDK